MALPGLCVPSSLLCVFYVPPDSFTSIVFIFFLCVEFSMLFLAVSSFYFNWQFVVGPRMVQNEFLGREWKYIWNIYMNILKCTYENYFIYKKVMPTINILTCYFISILDNDITMQGSWHFILWWNKSPHRLWSSEEVSLKRKLQERSEYTIGEQQATGLEIPWDPNYHFMAPRRRSRMRLVLCFDR